MSQKKWEFLDINWYTSQIVHDMLNGASSTCCDRIVFPIA